jgi:hypothetical protein
LLLRLVALEFELRALHLLGKLSTTSATLNSFAFSLVLFHFQVGSCAFPWPRPPKELEL